MIVNGGHCGTGLVIPHRREPGQRELPGWQEEHNRSHRKVRARIESAFAGNFAQTGALFARDWPWRAQRLPAGTAT
ncbi:transposase [Streptomyces sp. 769]|nr:transposase [Streptomyces sp. 769]